MHVSFFVCYWLTTFAYRFSTNYLLFTLIVHVNMIVPWFLLKFKIHYLISMRVCACIFSCMVHVLIVAFSFKIPLSPYLQAQVKGALSPQYTCDWIRIHRIHRILTNHQFQVSRICWWEFITCAYILIIDSNGQFTWLIYLIKPWPSTCNACSRESKMKSSNLTLNNWSCLIIQSLLINYMAHQESICHCF